MSQALLQAVRDGLEYGVKHFSEGAQHIERALSGLKVTGPRQTLVPQSLEVVDRYLKPAVALAVGDRPRAIAQALLAVNEDLLWFQAYPEYADDPFLAKFRSNFAVTILTWPYVRESAIARYINDVVGVAFTLQAPHIEYPPHVHKAVEHYYPLGGTAYWKRGEEEWAEREPGHLIFHDTGVRHAIRTTAQPLLSMAIWVGDFESQSVIVRA